MAQLMNWAILFLVKITDTKGGGQIELHFGLHFQVLRQETKPVTLGRFFVMIRFDLPAYSYD
ncbi:hypothetical protein SAMN05192533_102431 [Mesobacillus persicus]|uniref:Uncharacterized protein n=1 Tax=Mesobacillus persicus TaxID=930146 RepID=A0A1H7XY04_9BACI|nr:hypothetical protein SAMN05192533_102431 [Mesobacillus persicus]